MDQFLLLRIQITLNLLLNDSLVHVRVLARVLHIQFSDVNGPLLLFPVNILPNVEFQLSELLRFFVKFLDFIFVQLLHMDVVENAVGPWSVGSAARNGPLADRAHNAVPQTWFDLQRVAGVATID